MKHRQIAYSVFLACVLLSLFLPFFKFQARATGVADGYGNQISLVDLYQQSSGLWSVVNSTSIASYVLNENVSVASSQPTILECDVYLNGTVAFTGDQAKSLVRVYLTISGVVTDYAMLVDTATYLTRPPLAAVWNVKLYYPTVFGSTYWTPSLGTNYTVTFHYEWYSGGWTDAETWTVHFNCGSGLYNYVVHGPFLETGTVYDGIVNASLSYVDSGVTTFTLNGTDGVADDVSLVDVSLGNSLHWNITTAYYYNRMYVFRTDSEFDEVWLYVPAPTDIAPQYSITVVDLAGLHHATVETDRNIGGFNRIIERQQLDLSNAMPFWLIQFQQYTLKVVSDEGIFTWNLPADGLTDKTYWITRDMVATVSTASNITVTATRLNATSANVYFYDPSHVTASITSTIYVVNMTGQYSFYNQTDVGYVQDFTVVNLDALTTYLVKTVAAGGTWITQLGRVPASSSMWGVSFDFLGDWSYIGKNAVGMFIVMAIICVGSWKDTEWFLAAGIIVAAFLVFIGVLSIPWAGIAAALLVVILMQIDKGKKELPYS